jgi:hypothetical protein
MSQQGPSHFMRAYLNSWPISKSLTRVCMHRLSHTQACTHTGFPFRQWERIRAMIPSFSLTHTPCSVSALPSSVQPKVVWSRGVPASCVCVRLGVCVSELSGCRCVGGCLCVCMCMYVSGACTTALGTPLPQPLQSPPYSRCQQ